MSGLDEKAVETAARAAFEAWWNQRGPGIEVSWLASKAGWLSQQRAAIRAYLTTVGPKAGTVEVKASIQAVIHALEETLGFASISFLSPGARDNLEFAVAELAKLIPAPSVAEAADPDPMSAEEHRLEDLKQMVAYTKPIVSFDVRKPYYLASCDRCGWVGSSELCGTDSGDDSDVYCPRCHASGADCGKVAAALERCPSQPSPVPDGLEAMVDQRTVEMEIAAAVRFANRTIEPIADQPIAHACEGSATAIILSSLNKCGFAIVRADAITALNAERDRLDQELNVSQTYETIARERIETAERERDEALRETAAIANEHAGETRRAEYWKARAETAERDLSAAEEVIRPFADAIGDEQLGEDDARREDRWEIWEMSEAMSITLGHLRAARSWLAGRAK